MIRKFSSYSHLILIWHSYKFNVRGREFQGMRDAENFSFYVPHASHVYSRIGSTYLLLYFRFTTLPHIVHGI